MPIRPLDEWFLSPHSNRTQKLPLSTLKDTVLGIDASWYLQQHLINPATREALLGALGGFPFALKKAIEKELSTFKSFGISLVFVFNGLQFGKQDRHNKPFPVSALAFEQAWELYDAQQADQVVDAFCNAGMGPHLSVHACEVWSNTPPAFNEWNWPFREYDGSTDVVCDSGTPPPETLYKFLQRILFQNGVQFMVAPYSAAAQLSYLVRGDDPTVDAIYGPSETLLFDVERLIIKTELEHSQFTYLSKQTLQEELGRLSNNQFLEFCLLLGSPFLRSFPLFDSPLYPGKLPNVRDALPMFNSAGRNALNLLTQYDDDRRVQELQYIDRYKRAYMVVKHHIFMDIQGRVGPMDPENSTSDMHELIGLRLPEELYYYISRGVLGTDIPNFLTAGEVRLSLPLGTEDTEIYRHLVVNTLNPIRRQALCLLASSLHRFYMTKPIDIVPWFVDKPKSITLKGYPSVRQTVEAWRIPTDMYSEKVKNLQAPRGSFLFAVQSLEDEGFAWESFVHPNTPVLSAQDDILANVMWRFLQLRGYVDDKHYLTEWGKCLAQALSNVGPELESSVFLAIEMIRFDLINTKPWFSHVSGGPMRGSDNDKAFNNLVSRVACIGKLRHKNLGYSGPLSRQLLNYRSLISEVRTALRSLIEVVLTSLMLCNDVERDREDWSELAVKLPFIDDNDCGLGIAVQTYLDDLPSQANPTSPEAREEAKSKGKEWFQHSESFSDNLDVAFKIWDAVYTGTQNAPEFKDSKLWNDANKWLSERR
ncbi:hypothetical protein N7495_005188 [Penicillium taxi]|uniref:uncharacterized protein n=1 Tax=Penicillium taxi TaxID=168475 RepID=UPI0025451DAE|nr:uncharacterized protein N7495_005188 [Penicillium taxi]KAJ5893497.1 hypothetical protein N7495_005188 [Penicillium taxi]